MIFHDIPSPSPILNLLEHGHATSQNTHYTVIKLVCQSVSHTHFCRKIIGFVNFQKVELEHLRGEVNFLRLDQLAGLGCCCFCSIQYIVPDDMLQQQPEVIRGFLNATQRGAAYTTENPDEAFELLCQQKPQLRSELFKKIFTRTLPFFSRTMLNVERDWNKVSRYMQHLELVDKNFSIQTCFDNQFLPDTPHADIKPIACCLE